MSEENFQRRYTDPMTKYVGAALQGIVLLLLSWVLNTLMSVDKTLNTQIATTQIYQNSVTSRLDVYAASIADLQKRVSELEYSLRTLREREGAPK